MKLNAQRSHRFIPAGIPPIFAEDSTTWQISCVVTLTTEDGDGSLNGSSTELSKVNRITSDKGSGLDPLIADDKPPNISCYHFHG